MPHVAAPEICRMFVGGGRHAWDFKTTEKITLLQEHLEKDHFLDKDNQPFLANLRDNLNRRKKGKWRQTANSQVKIKRRRCCTVGLGTRYSAMDTTEKNNIIQGRSHGTVCHWTRSKTGRAKQPAAPWLCLQQKCITDIGIPIP